MTVSESNFQRRLLLIAYGCRPNAGSENATGWSWLTAWANRPDWNVTVVTPKSNAPSLDGALGDLCVRFLYVNDRPFRHCLIPSELHSTIEYLRFTRDARRTIAAAAARSPFDLAQHVSWTNIRTPSPAFAAKAPVILGPVGGGQRFPTAFAGSLGQRAAYLERLRNLQVWTSIWNPALRRRLRAASIVIVGNAPTAEYAQRAGARRIKQMHVAAPAFGARVPSRAAPNRGNTFRLLWVGRLLPRKAVGLAIDATKQIAEQLPVELTIAGDGPDAALVQRALHSGARVRWLGEVPFVKLTELYLNSDALLFTSLRDSGAPPLAEAMSYGLPAVILEHHGAAIIGQGWTLGVKPVNPTSITTALANRVLDLASDPDLWQRLSEQALKRAEEVTFERKVDQIIQWFAEAA